ncbi:MAG: hypothetical protein V4717_20585 [Bacteroidota bacterium]
MKLIAIIISTFVATFALGQTLSQEIDNIYNFQPSKLSDKEQESKFPALDEFWNKVKGDTSNYLPQLRAELMQTGHNAYFYYDGSGLLLSLSDTKSDKNIAVKAIAKCDLSDISRKIYVSTLNKLAQDGIDVTEAAVRILYEDKFSFFLPQHAMSFNQGYCLTYMLLPQKNNKYVDTLISMFASISKTAKILVITTLWFAYLCKGDNFLQSVMTDQTLDKDVRAYAKKLMGYTKLTHDQEDYIKNIGKENLDDLRESSLQRFSDESIEELDMTTRILRNDQNCH